MSRSLIGNMDANHHHRFAIPDRSFSSLAKRDITRLAEGYGFSPNIVGKVNIVVSEMTSNLAKHAPGGGTILLKPIGKPLRGIEIICLDNGPGMNEPQRMLEDGVSTFGSAGEGLGAIKRQSDDFDLYSHAGLGTVIVSRIYKAAKPTPPSALSSHYEVGAVMAPKPSEVDCGDGYAVLGKGHDLYLMAIDGLGHGPQAHEAAKQVAEAFRLAPGPDPANALRSIHESVRRTRGAVGFLAHIIDSRHLSYCGVGNIAGKLFSTEGGSIGTAYKNIISYNGIIGHNIPGSLHNQQLEWSRNKLLVLHSDGLKSRWDLSKYPNLHRHHASTIAAVIYRDFSRHTDDTLVLVCKAII